MRLYVIRDRRRRENPLLLTEPTQRKLAQLRFPLFSPSPICVPLRVLASCHRYIGRPLLRQLDGLRDNLDPSMLRALDDPLAVLVQLERLVTYPNLSLLRVCVHDSLDQLAVQVHISRPASITGRMDVVIHIGLPLMSVARGKSSSSCSNSPAASASTPPRRWSACWLR